MEEVTRSLPTEYELELEGKLRQYEERIEELESLLRGRNADTNATFEIGQVAKVTSEDVERLRVLAPCPLAGCVCQNCQDERDAQPFVLHSQGEPLLNLGDEAMTACGRRGTVRYVGHVRDDVRPALVYAGLELAKPGTSNRGGKPYLDCAEDRAYLVPLHRIRCVLGGPVRATPRGFDS